ncbi:MAG: hypothetical protein J2P32_06515 [Actinobacteria bacterium]|nr:hypothetical protein [Actinomycetota bacterium]
MATAGTRSGVARRRQIGRAGTAARAILGLGCAGIIAGIEATGFRWQPLALGLGGFPAVLLAGQWLRARRHPAAIRAIGPVPHVLNVALFGVLFATPWYAPPLWFTSNAATLFYGLSMVVAAVRGYAGCEVLAISNWLLRRDDQAGCLLFAPLDQVDRWHGGRRR